MKKRSNRLFRDLAIAFLVMAVALVGSAIVLRNQSKVVQQSAVLQPVCIVETALGHAEIYDLQGDGVKTPLARIVLIKSSGESVTTDFYWKGSVNSGVWKLYPAGSTTVSMSWGDAQLISINRAEISYDLYCP